MEYAFSLGDNKERCDELDQADVNWAVTNVTETLRWSDSKQRESWELRQKEYTYQQ